MPDVRCRSIRSRRLFLFFALLILAAFPAPSFAQVPLEGTQAFATSTIAPTPIPLTYDPAATKKAPVGRKSSLGRVAIIALGSLPFTVFYTDFVFDSVHYVVNGFDLQYAPWPFKNQYSADVGTTERFIRLGVSLGVSLVIGLLDLIIPPGT